MSEIAANGDQFEAQKVTMSEKDGELARQSGEIDRLKGMVTILQRSPTVEY